MGAFFNHAGASPPSDAVVERMIGHLRREQQVGGYEAAAEVAAEFQAVRAGVARLVGGAAAEVALTAGATDAFERFVWALLSGVGSDTVPRIVVDPFTYSSMWLTLGRWSTISPVDVVVAEPMPDGTVDLDSLASLTDPSTTAVVITHMPTHQGTVTDAAAAFAVTRDRAPDAIRVLDVSQTAGQLPLDVATLGCDVAYAPGRKFLRAPRGTGFLWVTHGLTRRLTPLSLPFGSSVHTDGVDGLPDDTTRFETFERSIAAVLGLGVALDHVDAVGIDMIAGRVDERSDRVRDVLARHHDVCILGTPADRGIVTMTHRTIPAADLSARLVAAGVANRCIAGEPPMQSDRGGFGTLVRLSPHECTTDDELDLLDRALTDVTR